MPFAIIRQLALQLQMRIYCRDFKRQTDEVFRLATPPPAMNPQNRIKEIIGNLLGILLILGIALLALVVL